MRHHRALVSATTAIMLSAWWSPATSRAQTSNPSSGSGLPPVLENLGLENPPDLPTFSSGSSSVPSSPAVNNPIQPSPSQPGSGSVLDALDNLPPVGGSTSQPDSRTSAKPGTSPTQTPEIQSPVIATPPQRVVRFGDVKPESSVRDQFPELRNKPSTTRAGTNNDLIDSRPGDAKSNRRGLFGWLMPWRRQPNDEPPLVVDRPQSRSRDTTIKNETPSANLSRAELADRVDSDIQKRVERTARQKVGTRTQELDVQVVNREVYIRARPLWFWQRRVINDELKNLEGVNPGQLHITVY